MTLAQNFIESRQWAILENYLQLMAAIADRDIVSRDAFLQAIEKEWGPPLNGTAETTVRDGIAIIPVAGPMFRYANMFTNISGATSYERLAADIGTAMRDPDVRRVIYDINTPGGETDGASETADLIYGFRGTKPQTAFVSNLGASAGYLLASAADEVMVSKMSMVGSIGAVLGVTDRTKMDEERGIRRMEFVSSVSPDKRVNPFSDDADEAAKAKATMQALVDRMGEVFVESVASYRGMKEEEITRARGGILIGPDAVDAGLADGVWTLEGLIKLYSTSTGTSYVSGQSMGLAASAGGLDHTKEVPSMAGESEGKEVVEVQIDLAYLTSKHPELVAEIGKAAASKERDRILKIHALDAAGFDAVKLEKMQDPKATAGDAAEAILYAKGEQEKLRKHAVENSLNADEGDVAELGAADLPAGEGDGDHTEAQLAAGILKWMPQVYAAASN